MTAEDFSADGFITDPFLQSVLASADQARAQCLSMLEWLDAHRTDSPSQETELELSTQQKLLMAQMAKLRGLNRKAVMAVRATKQQTQEAKSENDSLHLQLQNLYYEQRHLRGEIAGCEGYDHKYQSLPLIPVDEFLTTHPELADASEHDLMIARINHEHSERQALEEQRQGLLKRKQAMVAENNKKREEVAAMDKTIENFVNSSNVVQKAFDEKDKKDAQAQQAA